MVKDPEFCRSPWYFHSPVPEDEISILGEDRWRYLTAAYYQTFFTHPSFHWQRQFFGGILCEMRNKPWDVKEEMDCDDYEILVSIGVIQGLCSMSGIIQGHEIQQLIDGTIQHFPEIKTRQKYFSFDRLKSQTADWSSQGQTIGIFHGALDPPHCGHAENITAIWPHCDKLLVGFDPSWYLFQRKGVGHPRFPLAWRMFEFASLPTVDAVFVLPVKRGDETEFTQIYSDLNIRVMGCGTNNLYKQQYRLRMESMGGRLITHDVCWSSTEMMNTAEKLYPSSFMTKLPEIRSRVRTLQKRALAEGFLGDFKDKIMQTDTKK